MKVRIFTDLLRLALYGNGFSYSRILDKATYRDPQPDETVQASIRSHQYDLVVYGSVHRGTDLLDLVKTFYTSDEIVYVCGEDIHECEYAKQNLQNFFQREIS